MRIVGGGTGSGKSSSLYSLLNERRRARPDQATVMVEDPIEYRLSGVTQIQAELHTHAVDFSPAYCAA